jgi:hypothetical protein
MGAKINRRWSNTLENLNIKCQKCQKSVSYANYHEHTFACQTCIFCDEETSKTTAEIHKQFCKYSRFKKECPKCEVRVVFDQSTPYTRPQNDGSESKGFELENIGVVPPGHKCGITSQLKQTFGSNPRSNLFSCFTKKSGSYFCTLLGLQFIACLIEVSFIVLASMVLSHEDIVIFNHIPFHIISLSCLGSIIVGFILLYIRWKAIVAFYFVTMICMMASFMYIIYVLLVKDDPTLLNIRSTRGETYLN